MCPPDAGDTGRGPTETADLRLSRVRIENFRGIESTELSLSEGATILVGENNAGKTSILRALSVALGSRHATRDDLFRRGTTISTSATIDIFLSPASGPTFSESTRQLLQSIQREPDEPRSEIVVFRTELAPSNEGAQLTETRSFRQPSRGDWVQSQVRFVPQLLRLVEVHLLDASRDLMTELGNQSSTWGRVVGDLQVPDLADLPDGSLDPAGRAGLEAELSAFAERLRQASPVLKQLEGDLRRLRDSQTTVGDVALVALPPRVEELARTIEVVIEQRDATTLPLRFHGLGSRSLAALLVFQTLCALRVGMDQGVKPLLVTLLEEPEAHLHPQAVVALRVLIGQLEGQALVTTHSPQLVAELPPEDIRLIRRTTGGTHVVGLPPTTAKRVAQFRRFVERPLGEIFFARLVVFADGTSERNALPALLAPLLGSEPAGLGVTFVDCESMGDPKLAKVVEGLNDLEIPWLLFADNDADGLAAVAQCADPATGDPLTYEHPNVVKSGEKQLEQMLIDAGYLPEVESVARDLGESVADDAAALSFLSRHKGWAPEAVARAAVASGKSIPEPVKQLAAAIQGRLAEAAEPGQNTP